MGREPRNDSAWICPLAAGDLASRHGVLWGHDGEGPGYAVSAFHAPDLRGQPATACAIRAVERSDVAADLVFASLALLAER